MGDRWPGGEGEEIIKNFIAFPSCVQARKVGASKGGTPSGKRSNKPAPVPSVHSVYFFYDANVLAA